MCPKKVSSEVARGIERDFGACVAVLLAGTLLPVSIDRFGIGDDTEVRTSLSLLVAISCPIVSVIFWKLDRFRDRRVCLSVFGFCSVLALVSIGVLSLGKDAANAEEKCQSSTQYEELTIERGLR